MPSGKREDVLGRGGLVVRLCYASPTPRQLQEVLKRLMCMYGCWYGPSRVVGHRATWSEAQ